MNYKWGDPHLLFSPPNIPIVILGNDGMIKEALHSGRFFKHDDNRYYMIFPKDNYICFYRIAPDLEKMTPDLKDWFSYPVEPRLPFLREERKITVRCNCGSSAGGSSPYDA